MGSDVVEQVRAACEEVLWPAAQATDQADVVPARNLEVLREAGAFGIEASCTPAEKREVHRLVGGACGATYFVWAQHEGPVRLLGFTEHAELRERWLPRLLSGEAIGGTAFAHLRRPGPPLVTAEPDGAGGWVLHGEAPWTTGWGINEVLSVAARTADGQVLWALVTTDQVQAGEPWKLAVMQATATVRLRLDDVRVPADHVLVLMPSELWDELDDAIGNRCNPAVHGVGRRAVGLLAELDADAGEALAGALEGTISDDERLASDADLGQPDPAAMAGSRATTIGIVQRATLALLAASGGRGIDLDHPAQRLVRESAFYSVQAQTPQGRAASLALHRIL